MTDAAVCQTPNEDQATKPGSPNRQGYFYRNFEADCRIPEQRLFLAVLDRALMDARLARGKKRVGMSQDEWEARNWFKPHSRHFRFVCECAGLDPSYVRRVYDRMMRGEL